MRSRWLLPLTALCLVVASGCGSSSSRIGSDDGGIDGSDDGTSGVSDDVAADAPADSDASTHEDAHDASDGAQDTDSDAATVADAETDVADARTDVADAGTDVADAGTDVADAGTDPTDDVTPDSDGGADPPEVVSFDVSLHPELSLVVLVSMETNRPVEVSVAALVDGAQRVETAPTALSTTHELDVVGLRAETAHTLTATLHDGDTTTSTELGGIVTGPLPEDLPEFEVEVRVPDATRGVTIFAPASRRGTEDDPSTLHVGVDRDGHVVWYARGFNQSRTMFLDQLSDGGFYGTFNQAFAILERTGEVRTQFNPPTDTRFHHDATRLPNGNLLGLVYQTETLSLLPFDEPRDIQFDVITETTPDGEIVWEWRMIDYLDENRFPSVLSGAGSVAGRVDWSHSNAITYDPSDDTFMVSVRHQNWIIKASRATGELLWRLGEDGDFELTEGEWFYAQHAHETLPDGSILLFDNGNERPVEEPYSRAVRYAIDEDSMTARQVWEHRVDTYSSSMSAANRITGGYLVTAWADRTAAQVYELSDDGDITWRLTTPGRVFRATRIDSFYP